ncbi:hypothetical protein DMP05_07290 [Slackia isoflavoniconvertens]|uniref:Uncharacterized protein n=1 Tax=Slackia isoflavoniconvertens TaxID=572010 RepID=A0A3N0IAH3_9ACTN|nr:hypothetical protein DMP05_07290 [Slackia isoflavoniconvertens]
MQRQLNIESKELVAEWPQAPFVLFGLILQLARFLIGVDALLLTGRLWVEWVVSGAYFGPTGSDGVGRFARPCFRGEKGDQLYEVKG